MKPPVFMLRQPKTVEEALALLAADPDGSRVLAGGQSLVPLLNLRMVSPKQLIDLNSVRGMDGIRLEGDSLVVGAMTRQSELLANPNIEKYAPLLARAVQHVGHVQTRNRGTLGGSLAFADPSAELPLVMVVLDAVFRIRSHAGSRDVPARAFFHDMLSTDLAADELLLEIAIPVSNDTKKVAFREYARRHGDFAIVAAAAQYSSSPGGMVLSAGLGGLEKVPRHFDRMCAALLAEPQPSIDDLVRAEITQLDPLSDLHASGSYRSELALVALGDCLREVLP